MTHYLNAPTKVIQSKLGYTPMFLFTPSVFSLFDLHLNPYSRGKFDQRLFVKQVNVPWLPMHEIHPGYHRQ